MLTLNKQREIQNVLIRPGRVHTDQTENEANVCVARTTFRTLYDDGIMKKKLSQKNKTNSKKKLKKKCNVNINSDI